MTRIFVGQMQNVSSLTFPRDRLLQRAAKVARAARAARVARAVKARVADPTPGNVRSLTKDPVLP